MTNKEEDEVQKTIQDHFTIDEEAAQRIIKAHPIHARKTNIPNDVRLNKSERFAQAKRILESWE